MKFLTKSLLLLSIILMNILLTPVVVQCQSSQQDEIIEDDGSDEDVVVNDESANSEQQQQAGGEATQESEDGQQESQASPHIQTHLLFVKPETLDFPAGKLVRLVASLRNNGGSNVGGFVVDTIDASIRYPQDFQYQIQNFTTFEYGKIIESEREATFEYAFTPNEVFAGRPFGLVVNVNYRSLLDGRQYSSVLFNNTINVVDFDEGLDGETFFLYIFLAAIVVLLGVVAQHYFSTAIRKRVSGGGSGSGSKRGVQSNGGSNNAGSQQQSDNDEVDYEWIPKEHLQQPKQQSPRTSPRLRQNNRSAAASSGDEAK